MILRSNKMICTNIRRHVTAARTVHRLLISSSSSYTYTVRLLSPLSRQSLMWIYGFSDHPSNSETNNNNNIITLPRLQLIPCVHAKQASIHSMHARSIGPICMQSIHPSRFMQHSVPPSYVYTYYIRARVYTHSRMGAHTDSFGVRNIYIL